MKPLKAFGEIIDEQSAVIKAANRKIANGAEIDWRIIYFFPICNYDFWKAAKLYCH